MEKMKANVFHGKNDIRVEEVELSRAGVGEAVTRITLIFHSSRWHVNCRLYVIAE